MKTQHIIFALLILLTLAPGCKKTDTIVDPGSVPTASQAVYVVNEGNFGTANASLTVYLPDSLKAYQDVFTTTNSRTLGDVANDMVVYGKYGYIVVNNSQKIEVVLLETMKSVGTITIPGSKSPYKVAIYSDTKGYVTNNYDNSVTVFNPLTFTVVKDRIPVGLNPQGIAVFHDKLYVCNSGWGADSTISVIDPMTDAVVSTIVVDKSPSQIGVSADGGLIVKCDGVTAYPDPAKESAGSIVKFDPAAPGALTRLALPLATYGHPVKMAVSQSGAAFVIVKDGILKLSTSTMTAVNPQFVSFANNTFYSVGYDDMMNRLYVGDAGFFVSAGTVSVYGADGKLITSFPAGIGPGTITFKATK